MTYYKGKLSLYSNLMQRQVEVATLRKNGYSYDIINLNNIKYRQIEKRVDLKINRTSEYIEENKYIKDTLDEVFLNEGVILKFISGSFFTPIIFKIIYDSNGNEYGKELFTNLVFPIPNNKYITNTYSVSINSDYGNKYASSYVNINTKIKHDSFEKFECFIMSKEVADANEVKEYQEQFNIGFRWKKKRNDFVNQIQELYNKNVFKSDISFEEKKEVPRMEQSNETKLMENIEYLLQKLKVQDIDKYNIYNEEYEKLLTSEDSTLNINPLVLESLAVLEGKIEFVLNFKKKNASNILDYLHELKEGYLFNFLTDSNKKTDFEMHPIE